MPKTILGKWAMWLALGFIASFAISQIFYIFSATGHEISTSVSPILIAFTFLGFLSGIAGFITGLISIIKHKERAIIIYIVVVIGLFPLLFMIGEFSFPH